jgi:uncharacterized protein (DUF58 family)
MDGNTLGGADMKRLMVLVIVAVMALCLVAVALADATVVSVPSSISIAVGQEVDVPITVTGAVNWYGVDAQLRYDPTIVKAVKVTRGAIPVPNWVFYERTDVSGLAWYVAISLNPTPPANGNGVVCTVRLRGIAAGTSALTLQVVSSDRYGFETRPVAQNGSIVVASAPTAPVRPPRYTAP